MRDTYGDLNDAEMRLVWRWYETREHRWLRALEYGLRRMHIRAGYKSMTTRLLRTTPLVIEVDRATYED